MADQPTGTPAPQQPAGEHTPESDVTLSDEQLGELHSYDEGIGKTVKSALAQKTHWREKATKAEERATAAESRIAEFEKAKAGGQKKSDGETRVEYEQRIARLEFTVAHPGTPNEVATEVETYAKMKGISMDEAYKAPLMQTFIKERTAAQEAADATPGASNRVHVSGTPAFERIASLSEVDAQKVIRGMSKEDFAKYLKWRAASSAPEFTITKALNV